ncbi:sialate O-acetylesterase [Pedobacter sp. MC2016-14]|uniref:sialate O-acetylesterase n=1 Tax=Pedobacter sp. MC2016-14 TaxID=2897327 RepID=UPI001E5174CE|nr:sialate O-acetylesterase [Pedobacter sp. MC2016-14]
MQKLKLKKLPITYKGDQATDTHPYDDALVRIKAAMKTDPISGTLWLQGESDSRQNNANVYLEKLVELIARLRKETNHPTLPFVAGELGTYRSNYKLINNELAKLPAKVPFTAL